MANHLSSATPRDTASLARPLQGPQCPSLKTTTLNATHSTAPTPPSPKNKREKRKATTTATMATTLDNHLANAVALERARLIAMQARTSNQPANTARVYRKP